MTKNEQKVTPSHNRDDKEEGKKKEQKSFLSKLFSAVFNGIVLFIVFRTVQRLFFSGMVSSPSQVASSDEASSFIPCAWNIGQKADLFVYISNEPIQRNFLSSELMFQKEGIEFGSFDPSLDKNISFNYTLPPSTISQETGKLEPLFAHIYLVKDGSYPDPKKSAYDPKGSVYRRSSLIGSMPRPKETKNLVSGEKSNTGDIVLASKDDDNTVQYWYPEIRISLVQDADPLRRDSIPPAVFRHLSTTMRGDFYLPTLYMNEFWQLKDKRIIIQNEKDEVPLTISFSTMGLMKFQLLANFDQSLQMNEAMFGGDGETEKLKQMFIDTNPYLLAITFAVSIVHSIFDFLAFKNDIQFWRQRDNLQGLSVRSVMVNAVFQLIICLYLADQETSWLIFASMIIGTIIEFWKVTKVLSITFTWIKGKFPKISIKDRASYSQSPTQKYDELAMKYLGILSFPLLIGYSIYSLLYEFHKGWYSWILGTLVGFVYTFGFIMMTPQLFINYKMKSVAHMPWRVFIYKALNTFIDDLFAFVIKMPTLHRLACFRDDLVFLVYLYQRWIYPVDKTRANEYGQVFEEANNKDKKEEDATIQLNESSSPTRQDKNVTRRSTRIAKM